MDMKFWHGHGRERLLQGWAIGTGGRLVPHCPPRLARETRRRKLATHCSVPGCAMKPSLEPPLLRPSFDQLTVGHESAAGESE